MSFELYEYKIEDLGKVITGKTPPSKISDAFSAQGIPFVTPKDMDGRRLIDKTERYLSSQGVEAVRNCLLPQNSIAVSCIGSDMGKTILLLGESITNQQINAIVVDSERFDYKYVYYYLSTLQDDFKAIAGGSATPILNKGHFSQFKVSLPVKPVQNKIALILDSLDTKIEVNTEINQTLEQMAQALFKSWFVDFEPVKAKIAVLEAGGSQAEVMLAAMTAISGKDADALTVFEREHPEQYAELQATAELFPSAMQDSELGGIPEGWEYRKIGDYIDNISKTYPLKKVEQVVFLNTGDIKEGIFLHENKSDVGSLPGQAKKSIMEGDILYSEIRPINKRFAFVYFKADEYVVSTKLMVLRPKSKELSYYLYFLLSSNEVVSYLQLMAESRSGTFPQITYDTVSDIKILTSPDESVIKSFCKLLGESLYIPQQSIIKQNDMLTNIRDTLLPKLLSGEITLPEAEQAVSEVENV